MTVSRRVSGKQGPELSQFVQGFWRLNSWKLSQNELLKFVNECVELGVTSMDHAQVYRSEAAFGEVLKAQPALREQIEIITKCGIATADQPVSNQAAAKQSNPTSINYYDNSAQAILHAVDRSLSLLNTEYLDILLLHRPDYLLNADEVVAAFSTLKQAGKVKYFGVSNFSTSQFLLLNEALNEVVPEGLVTNQIEFSPLQMQALDNGVFDQCQQLGKSPMLWSCLAGGEMFNSSSDQVQRVRSALQLVAEQLGIEAIETVLYAWILSLPCKPFPVLGTRNLDRVKQAVAADQLTLSHEHWYFIWQAAAGHSVA